MITKSKLIPAAFAALMLTTAIAGVGNALAAENKTTAVQTAATEKAANAVDTALNANENKQLMKTVDEAYKGLREIRAARLAIFNGSPDAATKLVDAAKSDMQVAKDSMKDFQIAEITPSLKDDAYIPFDASMSLAEGFVPTADKQPTLQKANEHIAKGEHKQAAEVLKLAKIDVTFTGAFIPAVSSLQHVDDAAKLLSEKKYYEANLALKAVEDSVVLKSFGLDEVPAQGLAG
ncbi:YfdX family protein [Hoeflea sp.]|uniref:YfdX family protein n=1 Tax=Hoeflea sp. TaxID=1940281 RepID=UPI0037478A3D